MKNQTPSSTTPEPKVSRRGFLGRGLAATVAAAGLGATVKADDIDPQSRVQRANHAFRVRQKAAARERGVPLVQHATNGD